MRFSAFCCFLGRRAERPLAGRLDWLGFATLGLGIGALQLFLDRGERLDWFASREIQMEAALCVLGFYLFTVHSLSARDPFIDPALFRDRNFVIGIILIFIVGVVLLATLSMLTPYLEKLMNYPVLTAGLVLAPRGIGTMAAMLIVGQLILYIDARFLIATGLGTTGLSLYLMTGFTPRCIAGHLDPHRLGAGLWHRLRLRALGYGRVRHTCAGAAHTGNRAVQSDAQYWGEHRHLPDELSVGAQFRGYAGLAGRAHYDPFRQVVRDYAHQLNLASFGGRAALAQIVTAQAEAVAFIDNFKLMMLVSLLAIPLVILIQSPRRSLGNEGPASG